MTCMNNTNIILEDASSMSNVELNKTINDILDIIKYADNDDKDINEWKNLASDLAKQWLRRSH